MCAMRHYRQLHQFHNLPQMPYDRLFMLLCAQLKQRQLKNKSTIYRNSIYVQRIANE